MSAPALRWPTQFTAFFARLWWAPLSIVCHPHVTEAGPPSIYFLIPLFVRQGTQGSVRGQNKVRPLSFRTCCRTLWESVPASHRRGTGAGTDC